MNWQILIPLLITVAVAVTGWFSGHALNARRDRANKRREMRIKYLIDAYRQLENCSNREADFLGVFSKVESAIADIQLFGTKRQVELAQAFAVKFAQMRTASLDPLLIELREDLRDELELEPVPNNLMFLRYNSNPPKIENVKP